MSRQNTEASGHALATPDEVPGVDDHGPPKEIATIAGDRVIVDANLFVANADRDHLDSCDPLAGEWRRMRQTIAVFPFPHGDRGPLAEALFRDEIEYSAENIAAESACRWIVDKRLEPLFEIALERPEVGTVEIDTGGPASPNPMPVESWGSAFLRRLKGRSAQVAADRVTIGSGMLWTTIGGVRVQSECVTSIFHEAGSTDRIDVRVISDRRTVRFRFDSRNDPRFLAFWSRWRAEPSSDRASSTPA